MKKNRPLILLVYVVLCYTATAQKIPTPSVYYPIKIEKDGEQKIISRDSIPFAIEFLDGNNIAWKEMNTLYYSMRHCIYVVKNNKMEIRFLDSSNLVLLYDLEFPDERTIVMRNPKQKIFIRRE